MHNEFTAIIERDGDWYIAYCPEIPGANGQGRTLEECRKNMEKIPMSRFVLPLRRKICRALRSPAAGHSSWAIRFRCGGNRW